MWQAWSYALIRLAAALAVAVLIGLVTGDMELWLTIVLGGIVAWQFSNLFRLQRWLKLRTHEDPPDIGGVWGDVITIIDRIHRRKQFHKRRVMQQFREFRRLSAALPDGVVLLAEGKEIRWFNRTAAELLGLRHKVDVGIPIANLVRDPEFGACLARPGPGRGAVIRAQGADAWIAVFVVPAGPQFLMLVRDVTREVRLEEMRKDFVANASHELRSPLTVISGYVDELAEDHALAPEWREPVADMRRQAQRMREIVEDLLELSQLEATADEAPLEPVDVPALLARLVQEARAGATDAPRFDLDVDHALLLRGSEFELHSVASNLISNAVKYTPDDGRVTIRWAREPGGARLVVQDSGIGIAPEHVPRLTERFYRVDRARARAMGGSGLGLSIVKHGLQRHGGRLEIESEEGQGSTFTAHFPARRTFARQLPEIKAS